LEPAKVNSRAAGRRGRRDGDEVKATLEHNSPCSPASCGHHGGRVRGRCRILAWPCSRGGEPCPVGWAGSRGTRRAAGGTPTRARAEGSGAHRSASSSTAPRRTCKPACEGEEGARVSCRAARVSRRVLLFFPALIKIAISPRKLNPKTKPNAPKSMLPVPPKADAARHDDVVRARHRRE
jgi:hypothetical protein